MFTRCADRPRRASERPSFRTSSQSEMSSSPSMIICRRPPPSLLRNGIPRPPIKSFVRARRLTTPPPPPPPPTLSIGSGRDSSVVGSPSLPLPFLSLLFCPSAVVVVVVVIHNRDGVVGVRPRRRRRRTSSLSLSLSLTPIERTRERMKPSRSAVFPPHLPDQRRCVRAHFLAPVRKNVRRRSYNT